MNREISALSGKQKRYLRGLGNRLEDGVVVGHGGLSENFYTNLNSALNKKELVKVRLQPAAGLEVKETAEMLSEETSSQVVQTFGRTILLYKKNSENPTIKLP